MSAITLTDVTAVLGMIFGTSGLVLGILNHLRDRPKIRISAQWNMTIVPSPAPDQTSDHGLVVVTNIGRRPIFVSHVAVTLPNGQMLLLLDSVHGQKLSEGDSPARFLVPYARLEKYTKGWKSKDWKKIGVQISDSTGKVYRDRRRSLLQILRRR